MSRANVEAVRRAFEAWRALDVEAATAAFDPAVRWHVAEDEPDARTIEGVQDIVGALRAWAECFDDFHPEPQEFIDAGDHVVVPVVFSGRARDAAASLEIAEAQVHTVQDGRIAEVRVFRRVEDALAAAGLPGAN